MKKAALVVLLSLFALVSQALENQSTLSHLELLQRIKEAYKIGCNLTEEPESTDVIYNGYMNHESCLSQRIKYLNEGAPLIKFRSGQCANFDLHPTFPNQFINRYLMDLLPNQLPVFSSVEKFYPHENVKCFSVGDLTKYIEKIITFSAQK